MTQHPRVVSSDTVTQAAWVFLSPKSLYVTVAVWIMGALGSGVARRQRTHSALPLGLLAVSCFGSLRSALLVYDVMAEFQSTILWRQPPSTKV